ncbi:MAG: hypothetical protein ACPKQO_06460 [Nitrososphaeraceae archaeon]
MLIDDKGESNYAVNLMTLANLEYVKYHIKKFEESCCGDLPTTKAPSIFAPEGVFKGIDGVKQYISELSDNKMNSNTESKYW